MNNTKLLLLTCVLAGLSVTGCKKDEGPTAPVTPDPVASFTYSGVTLSPANISFQNTSKNANKYFWEFGDGTTSTVSSPTKTFNSAGTITVKLTASDSTTGKSASTSQQITIGPGPVASFTYSGQTASPANISFQNTSQNANKYLWEFGDGTTSTVSSPTKTFTSAGTFNVKLTASDSATGKSASISQQIAILPGPLASFAYSGQTATPAALTFQNSSLNANSYLWDFGDGTTSTLVNPTKTYTAQGTYTVRLTATNTSYNRSDTISKQIRVTPGSVFIDRIYVDNIPFVDASGGGWDLTSGPDLFANIIDSVSTALYSTRANYYLDVTPASLPVSWIVSPAYQITNWARAFYVDLWDYDGLTSNDYIGYVNGFRINTVISQLGYVTTLSLQNTSGTIKVRLLLRWQ